MKKTLLLLFAAIFTMGAMAKVGKITATADVASGDVWVFGFNPNLMLYKPFPLLFSDFRFQFASLCTTNFWGF